MKPHNQVRVPIREDGEREKEREKWRGSLQGPVTVSILVGAHSTVSSLRNVSLFGWQTLG